MIRTRKSKLDTGGRFATALLLAALSASPAAAFEVDLELLLAVDVSASVDRFEARQQRRGYLAALEHSEVIAAIQGGPYGSIAVSYVEWAGQRFQLRLVDWTVIDGPESAKAFVARLAREPINSAPYTSISAMIDYAVAEFARNGFTGTRRVIDISGDGPNSDGRPLRDARDAAVGQGITINGLPIISTRPNPQGGSPAIMLDSYYQAKVIGGPGAFIMEAYDFKDFTPTLVAKLVKEIEGSADIAAGPPAWPEPGKGAMLAPGDKP